MLIRFKVSNSRSIDKELEFSAIATEDTTLLEENTIDLPKYGIRLLKTMALFGANASGKSNILKAMADAWFHIIKLKEHNKRTFFNYCKNTEENADRPISYSFDILIEGNHYNYTFSHDKDRIVEEVLILFPSNQEEEIIYSRKTNGNNKYTWLPYSFFENENVAYFYKSTPSNELFLTIANKPTNSEAVQKIKVLEKIYDWFYEQFMTHISPSRPGKINHNNFITFILKSDENKNLILKLLKIGDINIKDMQVTKAIEDSNNKTRRYISPDGTAMNIIITTKHINSKNPQKAIEFDFFEEESHGTQQFVAWLGSWLLNLQEGKQPKIFVVDELGTNLHPILTALLMKIFYSKKINPYDSQLIFTSHEVKLMDKSLMRPDQLFFVNKVMDSTTIEQASDYEDINADFDKYHRLDNLYMHGGLSGIPNINPQQNLDTIL